MKKKERKSEEEEEEEKEEENIPQSNLYIFSAVDSIAWQKVIVALLIAARRIVCALCVDPRAVWQKR